MRLCAVLYLFVGVLGYLHRLGETKGDVLQNFAAGDAVVSSSGVNVHSECTQSHSPWAGQLPPAGISR